MPYFLLDIIRVYYYDATSVVPDKKEKMQGIIIQRIRNIAGFEERLGNLKITKKRREQKAVDTLIAIDMLSKAYENHYDIAFLIASDEDFVPVVDAVKNSGKRVYGVFFEGHISSILRESFDRQLPLNQDWFINNALKGKAKIVEFKVPEKMKTEQVLHIVIKIQTSITRGFLEFSITSSEGKEYNNTCGIITYEQSRNKDLTIPMSITIPLDMAGTKRKAFVIIYDGSKHENDIVAYRATKEEIELLPSPELEILTAWIYFNNYLMCIHRLVIHCNALQSY